MDISQKRDSVKNNRLIFPLDSREIFLYVFKMQVIKANRIHSICFQKSSSVRDLFQDQIYYGKGNTDQ